MINKMKEQLKDAKTVEEKQKIRCNLIDKTSTVMKYHCRSSRNSIMKHVQDFKKEFVAKQKISEYYDPANLYIIERNRQEKDKKVSMYIIYIYIFNFKIIF